MRGYIDSDPPLIAIIRYFWHIAESSFPFQLNHVQYCMSPDKLLLLPFNDAEEEEDGLKGK